MPEAVLRYPEGRYEGEVDDKQIPNGEGCLEFPGNDEKERQSYEGDFKDKKAHGKGIMRWRQGDKYDGEFQEGLRHGKGVYMVKVREFVTLANNNEKKPDTHRRKNIGPLTK